MYISICTVNCRNMNIFKKIANKKGFTLIELLVVIAIIGILAGVVLTNLSSSRNKAKNAAVLEELSSMRNTMELYATSHDGNYGNAPATYSGNCNIDFYATDNTDQGVFEDPAMLSIYENITQNGGTVATCTGEGGYTATVSNNVVFAVVLPSGDSVACIDSSGVLQTNVCSGGCDPDNYTETEALGPAFAGIARCKQN